MVAIINTGHSIRRAFNYNEIKVKEGVAKCIAAANYPKDVSHLSLSNKLNRLLNQAALNENVKRNSVHISLNFDPSENFSHEKLQAIADSYMSKIGFGNQPYLIYEHTDAGHPHIHIVTTKIRTDGSRIDTHNIGRNQSEKARKEIEETFGLIKAEGRQSQHYELKPINAQRIQYARTETKRAITTVLNAVLKDYKYTSLPELNAVLQQYNITADRGSENSRVYFNKGLVYRVLDSQGNKVGIPIKASDFYNKPTLKFLEAQFQPNAIARQPYKNRVKNVIDRAFMSANRPSLSDFIEVLKKEGIDTVLRQNEEGLVYGITYVDHKTKCVFNGSALGKQYSSKAIQEKCEQPVNVNQKPDAKPVKEVQNNQDQISKEVNQPGSFDLQKHRTVEQSKDTTGNTVLDDLLQVEYTSDYVPHQLKRKRKRKKRISKHF